MIALARLAESDDSCMVDGALPGMALRSCFAAREHFKETAAGEHSLHPNSRLGDLEMLLGRVGLQVLCGSCGRLRSPAARRPRGVRRGPNKSMHPTTKPRPIDMFREFGHTGFHSPHLRLVEGDLHSLADFARCEMPMFFFQFEVRPKETHSKREQYAGATVSCWVLRDTQNQAEAVARGWIGDEDWRITRVETATPMTREQQAEHPDGMQYFEQAEIDREVFVFHTWPAGAPDDKNVG